MYIETTTFAIPTFLLTIAKGLAVIVGVWLAIVFVGLIVYQLSE